MQPLLQSSKYYMRSKDCIAFSAQTQRDRNANAEENRSKLLEELQRLYSEAVPGDTSTEKRQKHAALWVVPLPLFYYQGPMSQDVLTTRQREDVPGIEAPAEEVPEIEERRQERRLLTTT